MSQSVCIKPEDMQYMIRDTKTGMLYDIRAQDSTLLLTQEGEKLTKLTSSSSAAKKPWEDWWQKKKSINGKLLVAAERGEKEAVLDLVNQKKHGDLAADVNTKGLDAFTPLHFASSEGHSEIVQVLLKSGANVDSLSTTLRTPLHVACNRGFRRIIEMLLGAGAKVNVQDVEGNTPGHILSEGGWQEALEVLLKSGADMRIKNTYGETPVEVAANLPIRQLCQNSIKEKTVSDTYSRRIVGNVIFHDNRADMVESLMCRARMLGVGPAAMPESQSSATAPEASPTAAAERDGHSSKSRRIKIIEATKRLTALGPEEMKQYSKPASREADPDLKEKIGPDYFDIITMLGRGSFGEVYLVRYKQTGALYAMKVLNKKRIMAQNILRYTRAERNVLCITKHPFIVGLEFAFQTSEKLFLVMEYCPG